MARLSLFEWLLSKAMKAVEQDLRDFDAIRRVGGAGRPSADLGWG